MNIYENIGLKRIINASGRMTALGVSTISDEVASTTKEAAQSYVNIHDLYKRSGEIISQYTHAEASLVTSCASAGIAMSVAGIIAKDNIKHIRNLPDSQGLKNEVIMPKGHSVSFGAPVSTMIRIGGGIPIEAGMVNSVTKADIISEINENTAAIIFVQSHHTVHKGMIALEDLIEVAHEYDLPIIVDAAAEEDMKKYVKMGVDLTIYSGAKALEAPSSGFITGKKELIDYAFMQYEGIGRPMKIGKENIMGLLKAMEQYEDRDEKEIVKHNRQVVKEMVDAFSKVDGLEAVEVQDEAGREIYRVQVKVADAIAFDKQLKGGNPEIHCRSHRLNEGYITIDTRSLSDQDVVDVIARFTEIVEG